MSVVEALVHPRARLFGLRHGLGRRPLFDGQRRCDRFAQVMLPMEEVRRVMRPEVLCHRRQQAWGLSAGRWDHLTVESRQGRLHARLPGVVIPRLGRLLEDNVVAHRLEPPQTEPTRPGFSLRHRDVFAWHLVRPPRALLVPVCHDGVFHVTVDLLRGPI
jgi:hypothetical protein